MSKFLALATDGKVHKLDVLYHVPTEAYPVSRVTAVAIAEQMDDGVYILTKNRFGFLHEFGTIKEVLNYFETLAKGRIE